MFAIFGRHCVNSTMSLNWRRSCGLGKSVSEAICDSSLVVKPIASLLVFLDVTDARSNAPVIAMLSLIS